MPTWNAHETNTEQTVRLRHQHDLSTEPKWIYMVPAQIYMETTWINMEPTRIYTETTRIPTEPTWITLECVTRALC